VFEVDGHKKGCFSGQEGQNGYSVQELGLFFWPERCKHRFPWTELFKIGWSVRQKQGFHGLPGTILRILDIFPTFGNFITSNE